MTPNLQHSLVNILVALGGAIALVIYRTEIQDAVSRFNRRGPGPPSAPLPADDSFLVRRKRIKKAE